MLSVTEGICYAEPVSAKRKSKLYGITEMVIRASGNVQDQNSYSGIRRDMTFVAEDGAKPSPKPTNTLDAQRASRE